MRSLSVVLILIPVAISAQSTTAQQARDTARIAAVVVTATRSPLALERAPSSVTVLQGEQLRRAGITTAVDALRQVPGLALAQTGAYGGATSLFIRGGESKFTKVLVDGVPVNAAGGAFDFSTLSTDNIERIEVVRGPASVLYGSDAVAGVVQIFTRRGTSGVHGELAARGGNFRSRDVDGSVRGTAGATDFSIGGATHRTDGIQDFNSGYRNDVISATVGTTAGDADGRITLRHDDAEYHFPTDGSGVVGDSNAVSRSGRLTLGVDAGYRLAPLATLRLGLASNDVHALTDNQPDSPGDSLGYYYTNAERSRRRSGDLHLDVVLPAASELTVGGQIERQWIETGTPTYTRTRRTTGVYGQLLMAPVDPVTATLGLRREHSEQFGDFMTYRAAASIAIAEGTRLRMSAGTAFREPTFMESYGGGFVNGNRNLRPEHSFSVDAGIEQHVGGWGQLGATYFMNSFRDLIDYLYSPSGGPDYFNIARTRASGLELEARAQLASGFHGDASFTYLDTRVVDPGEGTSPVALFVAGARLLRRPMHTLDVGTGYRAPRAGIDLRALTVGSREDNYYAPDFSSSHIHMPGYTRVDLSGDVTLIPATSGTSVAATLRMENLLDARYSEIAGYNYDFQRTDDASLRQTGYRAAGRRVLVGMRVAM